MKAFQLRPVLYFVVLSYSLAWLVALPLWLHGGLQNPLFIVIAVVEMQIPALAAIIVSKAADPSARLSESLGLKHWRPLRRTLLFCMFAVLASLFIAIASLVVGSAFGVYHFDLQNFSGLSELLKLRYASHAADLAKLPPLWAIASFLVLLMITAAPINAMAALGEEIGWRGWLLPRLLPLGTIPALAISGVIWALWHAPVILLGFNYSSTPGWLALACMSAMCIVFGSVLGWIRLRSGSVWPTAMGHGALNATAGLPWILGAAGQKIDTTQATLLGWTGWIVPGLLAMILFYFSRKTDGPAPQL